MARKIVVSHNPEIGIEFLQRAAGQETPYYVGKIHLRHRRKLLDAGSFSNNGCGGPTVMRQNRDLEVQVVDHMSANVQEVAAKLNLKPLMEPEGVVVDYAAMLHDISAACDELTLYQFVAYTYCSPMWGSFTKLTEEQEEAYALSRDRSRALEARKFAKKGKSVAYTEDGTLYTINTLNREEAAKTLNEGGVQNFVVAEPAA